MSLAAQDESRVSVACEQPAIGTAEKIIFNSRDGGHTFSRARQVPPLIGDGSNLARPSPGHFALACVSSRVTANLIYSSSDGRPPPPPPPQLLHRPNTSPPPRLPPS